MLTLEKETNNCKIAEQKPLAEENEVNREELCKKLCINILEGLLEGYNELKEKNPAKAIEFEPKIEELQQKIRENELVPA